MKKLSKKIISILENLGFYPQNVEKQDNEYYVEINCSTPAGEDWWETIWYNGTSEDFAEKVRDRANDFDIDEEVEILIGMRGAPGIQELVHDAEWKKHRLILLADELESCIYSCV